MQGSIVSNIGVFIMIQTFSKATRYRDTEIELQTGTELHDDEEQKGFERNQIQPLNKKACNDNTPFKRNLLGNVTPAKGLADRKVKDNVGTTKPKSFGILNSFSKIDLSMPDVLMTFGHFLFCCGDAFGHFMIGVRMDYIGLSKQQIVIAMAARGGISLTRPIPAFIIDRLNLNRIKASGMLTFLLGLSTMISVTFTTFPAILSFFIIWGFIQGTTGWARLIRSHSSARFCFELSGNSN